LPKAKKRKANGLKRGNKPGSNGGGGRRVPNPFNSKEALEKLKSLAASGIRNDDIAAIHNMGKSRLYQLMKEDPKIRMALENGRGVALYNVAQSLYSKAIDGDLQAQMFYLKTQGGWRDKSDDVQQQGMQSVTIVLPGQKTQQVISIGPSAAMENVTPDKPSEDDWSEPDDTT
jgi:hypothetical protein